MASVVFPILALISILQQEPPIRATGQDAEVRAVHAAGSYHLELCIKQGAAYKIVAVDTTHPSARVPSHSWLNEIKVRWTKADLAGQVLTLRSDRFLARLTVPVSGHAITVSMTSTPGNGLTRTSRAMMGFVLAPDGTPGIAQSKFVPPGGSPRLVTSERFATPLAMVRDFSYGLSLMPDVTDLETNRPVAPLMTVHNDRSVAPGAVLAYGFASFSRDKGWQPALIDEGPADISGTTWTSEVLIANADSIVRESIDHLWHRYGEERAKKPLPQTVPYRYYTKPTYDIPADKWWTGQDNGLAMRAPKTPDGTIGIDRLARFAWGMRWWGDYLQQGSWSRNANEVLNLLLTVDLGTMSESVFDTTTGTWKGSPKDYWRIASAARWIQRFDLFKDGAGSLATEALRKQKLAELRAALKRFPQTPEYELFIQESPASDLEAPRSFPHSQKDMALIALVLARSGDRQGARKLLERLMVAQAVWQPTTVAGTEVFGGFVGPAFLDEQQSQFSAELLEAAILCGDLGLAQRAVAAIRAPLALVKHQTHGVSGMELPTELDLMASSSWFGKDGLAAFGPSVGIAEGTAQTLTSIAYATEEFGSVYTSPEGWKLAIDGLEIDADGKVYSSFSRNPLAFQSVYPYIEVDGRTGEKRELADPPVVPAFRAIKLAMDSSGPYVVALPGFAITNVDQLTGSFVFSDGRTAPAEVFPSGLGIRVSRETGQLPGIAFRGIYQGRSLSVSQTFLSVGPPDLNLAWPGGWRRMKGLTDVVRSTLDRNGVTVMSTADDGRGRRRGNLTGIIESQAFLMTGTQLSCQTDSVGQDVRIEVIDLGMGTVVATKSGTDASAGTMVFDLPSQKGAMLRIRLVDESKTGWIDAWDFQVVGS